MQDTDIPTPQAQAPIPPQAVQAVKAVKAVTGWSPDLPDARRRTCHKPGCTETLVYRNGDRITEAFAISLGQWLTVMGETLQPVTQDGPDGPKTVGFHVRSDIKTFCSTQCLKEYIDGLIAEYDAAEDRVVEKMKAEHPDIEKLQAAAYGVGLTEN